MWRSHRARSTGLTGPYASSAEASSRGVRPASAEPATRSASGNPPHSSTIRSVACASYGSGASPAAARSTSSAPAASSAVTGSCRTRAAVPSGSSIGSRAVTRTRLSECSGHQRRHLPGVGGVVQHHDHGDVGQMPLVQLGQAPRLLLGRAPLSLEQLLTLALPAG